MNNYYPNNIMYERNSNLVYPQNNTAYYPEATYASNGQDERFFLAPFLVGGLAGTALGYGIANNNQMNQGGYYMTPAYYMPMPMSSQPMYYNNNYYY